MDGPPTAPPSVTHSHSATVSLCLTVVNSSYGLAIYKLYTSVNNIYLYDHLKYRYRKLHVAVISALWTNKEYLTVI